MVRDVKVDWSHKRINKIFKLPNQQDLQTIEEIIFPLALSRSFACTKTLEEVIAEKMEMDGCCWSA